MNIATSMVIAINKNSIVIAYRYSYRPYNRSMVLRLSLLHRYCYRYHYRNFIVIVIAITIDRIAIVDLGPRHGD